MKFSIITPSFNQGRFLKDCVESVLSQKGVDIEHIVTDACSTDETLEILASYPHLIWSSEPDKGMSDGINKGFLKASGDWVMWLNCDDYLLPGALEKVTEFIKNHKGADIIHGDCVFVREDKSIIRRKYDHAADEFSLLFTGCFIPSTSTFFHRRIIDDGNLLDITYKVCMDLDYYLRLMRANYRYVYLPEALAGFRWHGANTSLTHSAKGWEEAIKLQREHITARGMKPILANRFVLAFTRRFFQLRRIFIRYHQHGRFF